MNTSLKCLVCNNYEATSKQDFNNHIVHTHNMKSKEYYDTFLKVDGEDNCSTPDCPNPTTFRDMWYGYNKHCCKRCTSRDPAVQKQMKDTCKEKYGTEFAFQAEEVKSKIKASNLEHFGVECSLQSKEVQEKCKATNLMKYGAENVFASDYGKRKIKETITTRYGVEYSFQAEVVKNKSKQTKLDRYGDENYNNSRKAEETSLEKYGVSNPAKSPKIQQKMQDTCMEKYGVKNAYQSRELMLGSAKKRSNTQYKNGNQSSLEDYLEMSFIENGIVYESQYNLDSRYPYFCDFYLPEKDAFVEINGFVTHGGHWFDSTSAKDISIVDAWKSKMNEHELYRKCIEVWTISDVEKRNCAKKNNLNYIVLWTKDDITNWINSNFEIRKDF